MSTSVIDVAERLLTLEGEMSPSRLQTLLVLGQAATVHSLGKPLFDEKILASDEGLIIPALSELHGDAVTVTPGFFYEKLTERLALTSVGDSASVVDVAEHILSQRGEMSTMKLQKLLYFSQGWNLAMTGKPLFKEQLEAWPSGPVVRELYELHKDEYSVGPGFFYEKLQARQEPASKIADGIPVG